MGQVSAVSRCRLTHTRTRTHACTHTHTHMHTQQFRPAPPHLASLSTWHTRPGRLERSLAFLSPDGSAPVVLVLGGQARSPCCHNGRGAPRAPSDTVLLLMATFLRVSSWPLPPPPPSTDGPQRSAGHKPDPSCRTLVRLPSACRAQPHGLFSLPSSPVQGSWLRCVRVAAAGRGVPCGRKALTP